MRRALAIGVVVSAVAVPSASGVESTIYPGVGIGKIHLTMTLAQVERILGKSYIVDKRETISGAEYRELGWNFDTWVVGVLREGSTYRVVRVATTRRSQRTPKRVGPGSFWLQLHKAYPYGLCTFPQEKFGLEYLVPHKGGTQTIYWLLSYPPRTAVPTTWSIVSVEVRSPYQRLPEFKPSYPYRCDPDTLSSPFPQPYPRQP